MTFAMGYLTERELSIWGLRREEYRQVEIGRKLGVTRQAIHKALGIIDEKIEQALTEAAEANKLEVKGINLVDGVMEAYSPAYQIPVIVSLSKANGMQVWYLYEGNCVECSHESRCMRMLQDEAEERGIQLSKEDEKSLPTNLALKIFSRYVVDLK